jgi:hypothetical protein
MWATGAWLVWFLCRKLTFYNGCFHNGFHDGIHWTLLVVSGWLLSIPEYTVTSLDRNDSFTCHHTSWRRRQCVMHGVPPTPEHTHTEDDALVFTNSASPLLSSASGTRLGILAIFLALPWGKWAGLELWAGFLIQGLDRILEWGALPPLVLLVLEGQTQWCAVCEQKDREAPPLSPRRGPLRRAESWLWNGDPIGTCFTINCGSVSPSTMAENGLGNPLRGQ